MEVKRVVRPAVGAALVLLIPLAMTVIDRGKSAGEGWHWGPTDFLVMGLLLFIAGVAYELVASRLHSRGQRIVLGLAILLVVLAIWVQLAVDAFGQLIGLVIG